MERHPAPTAKPGFQSRREVGVHSGLALRHRSLCHYFVINLVFVCERKPAFLLTSMVRSIRSAVKETCSVIDVCCTRVIRESHEWYTCARCVWLVRQGAAVVFSMAGHFLADFVAMMPRVHPLPYRRLRSNVSGIHGQSSCLVQHSAPSIR